MKFTANYQISDDRWAAMIRNNFEPFLNKSSGEIFFFKLLLSISRKLDKIFLSTLYTQYYTHKNSELFFHNIWNIGKLYKVGEGNYLNIFFTESAYISKLGCPWIFCHLSPSLATRTERTVIKELIHK